MMHCTWGGLYDFSESGVSTLEGLPEDAERFNGSDNNISIIPQYFGNFGNLRSFDLGYNEVSLIPESFGNIENLRSFHLDCNEIFVIPESIRFLENIDMIDFKYNNISIVIPNKHVSKIFIGSNKILNI